MFYRSVKLASMVIELTLIEGFIMTIERLTNTEVCDKVAGIVGRMRRRGCDLEEITEEVDRVFLRYTVQNATLAREWAELHVEGGDNE